jgi:2-oxoacid:acceptor oxidoreductase delta subunit (pyruvate/2-ketoisovalerate family)
MKKKGWKELAIGGRIEEAGNAAEYETGSWRTFRPVRSEEKCTHCLRCWIYCPDSAIRVKDGKVVGFDLDHCKGCGICADVCPPKVHAIEMVRESELKQKEQK